MKRISLSLVLLFFQTYSFGQSQAKLISGDFNNVPFERWVQEIEKITPFHFFYDPSTVDSLQVNIQVDNKSIDWVLQNIFEDTPYHFLITNDKSILITYETEIVNQLPLGFFDINSSAPIDLELAALSFENEKEASDNGLIISIEDQQFEIGQRTKLVEGKQINLAGSITDVDSGEPIIGAIVYIEEPRIGVITNEFGYYNISLPQGKHKLLIRSVGMKETSRQIMLYSEGRLNIELKEDIIALKEIVVEAEKSLNITGLQMGLEKMGIAEMKQVSTVLGEIDVTKIALTLPGVQSVGEGASGFNVRGGAADQNLVTMNAATIYNPSHFFGFFSVFNPDVIKSASLLKGGIPAQYGGRVSSVFEVTSRDGNKKEFGLRGGISPVNTRLTFEGPLITDKSSILIGARSTYSNWLLQQVPDASISNSRASFYDIHAKISHEISDKDALSLSTYYSKDKFQLVSDSLYQYQNFNGALEWRHNFSNRLIGVLSGSYSSYEYNITQDQDSLSAFDMRYALGSANIKVDFTYFPSAGNVLDFGISSINYNLEPGTQKPTGQTSDVIPIVLENERAIESAIYIGDNYTLSENISVYAGLRYSNYNFLGPKTVYSYPEGLPKSPSNSTESTLYGKNKVIQSYSGPEYRLSSRYILNTFSSLKLGYNRMRQYIHMLTNTAAISPTDTWKLSDSHIRPQVGDQVSLGYYRNLNKNTIEAYVEVYYKQVQDILEFKGGARLLLNEQIETDLINGKNKSYGIEFLFKKKVGKLNGWISYTYSRSLNKVVGISPEESINKGDYFPANYDKPNNLNIIANYKFNRRLSLSSSFAYSTGRPITYPVAKYYLSNSERIFYSNRNEYRIPDYIRLDVSLQVEGNHKVDKPAHSSWSFSVYNLLGRDNVYSIYFVSEEGAVQGYKLSVFASAIPTITYNFKI